MIWIADTETTGTNDKAKIVEFAFVQIDEDLRILNQFQTLINPGEPIPQEASEVHGITDANVRHEPTIEELFGWVFPPLPEKMIIIGHYISFDYQFLQPYIKNPILIDTVQAARRVWPLMKDHKLQTLREELDIEVDGQAHRALADVLVVYGLLKRLCRTRSLREFIDWMQTPQKVQIMPWGKFKGERMEDIPQWYLRWMLRECQLDPDMKYTVEELLNDQIRAYG